MTIRIEPPSISAFRLVKLKYSIDAYGTRSLEHATEPFIVNAGDIESWIAEPLTYIIEWQENHYFEQNRSGNVFQDRRVETFKHTANIERIEKLRDIVMNKPGTDVSGLAYSNSYELEALLNGWKFAWAPASDDKPVGPLGIEPYISAADVIQSIVLPESTAPVETPLVPDSQSGVEYKIDKLADTMSQLVQSQNMLIEVLTRANSNNSGDS